MSETLLAATEGDMLALGEVLLPRLGQGGQVHLSGDLGMGKTTLVRGILRAMGYTGRVKSPSYGLVESYELPELTVHHLDLYRLSHGEELAFLGIEELIDGQALVLIEWPEKGKGFLASPDWTIHIDDAPDGGRVVEIAKN
ncbi:MAG: tRNA (adenosine(37)-N6)-threonylcarbamoyltransferase complex ATPase subunit type 1 TsaE [Pseudomonadota bacterium]